jgi:hypothetical protein
MNPETWIPFTVGGYPTCAEPSRRYSVSLRILNTIAQPVAVPVLQGRGNVAGGQKATKLSLTCGEYTAYWDGKDATGREVASGIYVYFLEVDGQKFSKKMNVFK